MSPEQRSLCALELGELVVEIAEGGVRARHPEYGEHQVRMATLRIRLGHELFREAYPDAPLLAS